MNTGEVMGWRTAPERYGRYWGHQEAKKVEVGEWEMGLNTKFNGPTLKMEYLSLADEKRGRVIVKQVKVLGQTIRLEGSVEEFAENSMLRMLNEKRLVKSPETITEIALFLTGVHREQRIEEKNWVFEDGRGNFGKQEEVEPETAVLRGIEKLEKNNRIGDLIAQKMKDFFMLALKGQERSAEPDFA